MRARSRARRMSGSIMGEMDYARALLRLVLAEAGRKTRAGEAVWEWVRSERDWLWPGDAARLDWRVLPSRLAKAGETRGAPAPALDAADAIAAALRLDGFDRALLRVAVALERLPRLAVLRRKLDDAGYDLARAVLALAGDGSGGTARLRGALPVVLGLIETELARDGRTTLSLSWTLNRVLDRDLGDEAAIADALLGPRQRARLPVEAYPHLAGPIDFLVRLLAGAARAGEPGVNVLLHGPPGTGKTELARTLAEAAGLALHAVGEEDEWDEEPTRTERLAALRRSGRILSRRGGAALLFDEMEDFLGAARRSADGGWAARDGSKVWANRTLETNPVPVIWTSNALGDVDPAFLRRMSFVLKLGHPPRAVRAAVVERIAREERVCLADGALHGFVSGEPAAASVARAALSSARLAGGGDADARLAASAIAAAVAPSAPRLRDGAGEFALDLYEADRSVPDLLDRLAAPGAPADWTLLLLGPPGTGKTALAAHTADRLGRELVVRRASDILSAWVGETEANIARAFREAGEAGAVLLLDEVDSLLADRANVGRSWEVSQVNELLSALDTAPMPVIAATNFGERLDPAALRRFDWKLHLREMSADTAARAFRRFFGAEAPPALATISGLTAGDYAAVRRQLRFHPADPDELVARLRAEVAARPGTSERVGF